MHSTAMRAGNLQPERAEKVLVVVAGHGSCDMISFSLEKSGYSVSTANEVEAPGKLATERPDLIILDVVTPGVTGYEVLERMRRASPTDTEVIVVGATPEADIASLCVAAYLAKPFGCSQLLWLVESVLSHSSSRREPDAQEIAA